MPYKRKDSPHYWISHTDTAGRRISRSSGCADYRQAKAEENQLRADAHRKRSPHAANTFDDVMESYQADLIMVALHTGLRHGELLRLEWSRVDLTNRVIHLAPEHQKGKKHSTVPLNAPARNALLRRAGYRATICPDSAWISTRKGSRIGSIKNSFATACQKAGIEDFHIHDYGHRLLQHAWDTGTEKHRTPISTCASI